MAEDIPELTISNMVTKNSIFAISAENALTTYFLILCESEEQEHLDPLKPYVDECGNCNPLWHQVSVRKISGNPKFQ